MSTSTFDITRQTFWDLWVWVCAAGCIVLLGYALFGRLWATRRGWASLALVVSGIGGTVIVLAAPPLRLPLVGMIWTFVLLCVVSATFYLAMRDRLRWRQISALLGIRIAALAIAVPMLFEPVLRYVTHPKPERPLLLVIDTSGSMSFPDMQNGPTRLQSVWQTLRPQLGRMNQYFVPRYFTFATQLDELKNAEDLSRTTADGKATDIAAAIQSAGRQSTRDDAAIVLISDGIDNASPNVLDAIRASRYPVHTLRVGSEQTEPATLPNIAVTDVQTAEDFVVAHESQVKATVKSTALANRVVDVKLAEVDEAGKPLSEPASQKLVLQPLVEGQSVDLPYKPTRVGVHRLAVWVDPVAGERSAVDNRQEFQGLALDPRIKVLYIEGRARPEYRPLKRALETDPNIELATLVRLQKDRFSAFGSTEGVAVRAIPSMPEQWSKIDVVIIGDLDSSFLTRLQQTQIEQAVSKGAGLLMIGGQNSFGPGSYKDTPIEKALPVFVGDTRSPQEKTQFVPRLTPQGAVHPAMEGLVEWFGTGDKAGEKKLPALNGNVVVPQEKSGAQLILIHPDRVGPDGKPQIVLAVQRYGQGRSAAFTADTTYLWNLPLYGMGQDSPYNRFWGQLARWLAGADVKNRQRGAGVEGLLNKNVYSLGENVHIRAMVRDERGDATRYAQVSLKLKPADGPEQTLTLQPAETHAGMYELTLPHPAKSQFVATLLASKDGKELGRQELKFMVIPPADEMLKIAANPALLAGISAQTHGLNDELARMPALLDELIRTNKKPMEAKQVSVPLDNYLAAAMAWLGHHPQWPRKIDLPIQGLLVVVLLCTEWILRRRWQLP